ncbi:hypothetical protein C22711_0626 [Escherichia coli O104:H4 str. C227-11]|nr:hypothetical protein C22711_0626 [Escherichia coli O104:H4 str. C227-11]
MSTEMKTGLVLSGGGAVGAYQAGVVKALAECGTQISMVSGPALAHSMVPLSRPLPICQKLPYAWRRSGIIWE